MNLSDKFYERVNVHDLVCNMDPEVAEVAYKAMNSGEVCQVARHLRHRMSYDHTTLKELYDIVGEE